ncbi:MAG: UDP-N-acetylmuramoyl-L-alanine--D-glutamate ligase [Actinomycetota bacterium]
MVLGLGVTGRAVARIAAQHGAYVLASDSRDVAPAISEELAAHDVDVESGSHDRAGRELDGFDAVVPSPGIAPINGFLADVIERGARITSSLDLAVQLTKAPVVAVTGTNGKTTVVRLAERIAREGGLDAYACGNTETPFLSAADANPNAALFVVEASSFALAFCEELKPRVAIVTNLAPDHLEWHGSFEHYRDSKARIAARQSAEDLFLFPTAQPELAEMAPAGGPRVAGFPDARSGGLSGSWLDRASHFRDDASAAAIALADLGIAEDAIGRAVGAFQLDAHRLEPVGSINGVRVVDDSVSTNPHAAVAALRSLAPIGEAGHSGRIVLIAGGRNKNLDLRPLAGEASRMRGVVALGEAAGEIVEVFAATGVGVKTVASMNEAVAAAIDMALQADVILLSPACSSKDMFNGFDDRGRSFLQACRQLGLIA